MIENDPYIHIQKTTRQTETKVENIGKCPFKSGDRVKWGTFIGKVSGVVPPNEFSPKWKVILGRYVVPAEQCISI